MCEVGYVQQYNVPPLVLGFNIKEHHGDYTLTLDMIGLTS